MTTAQTLSLLSIPAGAIFLVILGYIMGRADQKKKFPHVFEAGYQSGYEDGRSSTASFPPPMPPNPEAAFKPDEPMPPQRYGHQELKAAPSPRDW